MNQLANKADVQGFALFGWALFGRRSFRFSADKDVGPVEISLFLSPREELEDSESLLVWEVVKIGHSRRDFVTYCPVISGTSDGETKIGFATLQDEAIEGVNCIKPEFFGTAPAKWNGSEFESLLADDKHVLELGPEGHEVGFAIDGQYGPKVVEKFRDDIVTPDGKGVRLTDLGPISNWHISKGKDGKLKLKLTGKVKQKFKE
ncbi:hypothetical protein DXG01_009027 [Tephrocybe rancida]|nr:hypothetical protein DXG01_009027 [Tephrocybe rancida]